MKIASLDVFLLRKWIFKCIIRVLISLFLNCNSNVKCVLHTVNFEFTWDGKCKIDNISVHVFFYKVLLYLCKSLYLYYDAHNIYEYETRNILANY